MEFEEIDTVYGDTIAKGDIVCFASNYHQITGEPSEDLNTSQISFPSYNLSTGDEDEVVFGMDNNVTIFRSY